MMFSKHLFARASEKPFESKLDRRKRSSHSCEFISFKEEEEELKSANADFNRFVIDRGNNATSLGPVFSVA